MKNNPDSDLAEIDHAKKRHDLQSAASAERARLISNDWLEMKEIAERIQPDMIAVANRTRHIGRQLVEWRDAEQMPQVEFSAMLRELPIGLRISSANLFISAWHRHPEEITDLHEAIAVLTQQTFFAAGLMLEPERKMIQTASGATPFAQIILVCARQRELLEKYKTELDFNNWEEGDIRNLVEETAAAAELHERGLRILLQMK